MRWRGGLAALAWALALGAPRPSLALPGTTVSLVAVVEPSASVDGIELEVSVAAGIPEADELQRWVQDESSKAIAESPSPSPRRGVVRIAIEGALYDYQVTLTAVRDGQPLGLPQMSVCECSNEDLLGELSGRLPGVLEQLVVPSAPLQETIVEPPAPPSPEEPATPPSRVERISAGEVVGISLLVVGVAGAATGSALAAKDPTSGLDPEDYGEGSRQDYRAPGFALLASGAVVASTGLVLYLLTRNGRVGRSNVAISPAGFGMPHAMGVGLSGRF